MMAIYTPGLISVIVFYVLFLIIGLWAAWRSRQLAKTSEDVMLAGRSIGILLGIFTMTATWVEGGFINGSAEVMYSSGLVGCQAPIAYSVCLAFSGFFFANRMRQNGYTTIIDPFQQRYGAMMGGLLYIPSVLGDIFVVAATLGALGSTLSVVIGLEHNISVIIAACVAVVYTMFGGLYAVAYTDILQLIFMFLGVWLIIPFALDNDAVGNLSENHTEVWVKQLDPSTSGIYIDNWLQMILGAIPWQVYFQRGLASRSASTAELLSYLGVFGCFIFVVPSLLIGIIAKQTDWSETTYKSGNLTELTQDDIPLVLPLVMEHLCPKVVSLIGLSSVAAAVLSSVDSALLSSSGMFARNVYSRLLRVRASEREILMVLRVATVVISVFTTLLAIYVRSIYALWAICTDLVYVVLFPQLTCAIYFPFTNTYGSLIAFAVGVFMRMAGGESTIGLIPLIKYPWHGISDDGIITQMFPHKTFAMLCSLLCLLVVSLLTNYLFEEEILPAQLDIFRKTQKDAAPKQIDVMSENQTPLLEISNTKVDSYDVVS